MTSVAVQKMRVLRWSVLEALRGNVVARFGLGALRLTRGTLRMLLGRRYAALEDLCAVRRVARVPLLDGASAALERRLVRRASPEGLPSASANELLRDFLVTDEARGLVVRAAERDRASRIDLDGDLILLKEPDPATGELGVILVKYSPSFTAFAALYDLPRILEDYQVVLEPSWVGYVDPVFYLYGARDRAVVVEAHQSEDHAHLQALGRNLVPLPTGSSYWVDDAVFRPLPGREKAYVAIMVAHWGPLKRHELLLRALHALADPTLRVALVGYPWDGCGKEWLVERVKRHGLEAQVDFYESLPPEEVNALFNRSCANLLLSRKEGGNKATYEGMLAGTPCIVSASHRGIRLQDVNERTGMLVPDAELPAALRRMRECFAQYDPRAWALEHACYRSAHRMLERALEECAAREGRPWARGIAAKVNRPNLCYRDDADERRLRPLYPSLAGYLRPELRNA